MENKKNNERRIYTYVVTFIILIFISIIVYFIVNQHKSNSSKNEGIEEGYYQDDNIVEATIKPFASEKKVKVVINEIEYSMVLDNNLAAFDLLSILPTDLEMEDLNHNEKYSYLPFSLTNDDNYTGSIKKGDVMLYQSNCVVIFYKDLETDYLYTKLGHIDGLPDFGDEKVSISIDKE